MYLLSDNEVLPMENVYILRSINVDPLDPNPVDYIEIGGWDEVIKWKKDGSIEEGDEVFRLEKVDVLTYHGSTR